MIQTRTVTLEIPVPEPATLERALWGLVAVGLAADVLTTQVGLEAGLVESNPTARAALAHGTLGFLAMKAGAVGVGLLCRPFLKREHRGIVPVCLALPWLAAAAVNCYMLAQVGVLA
ncbi:DUF5658 family protein [Natrinema sp. DC36]|uniref:DUF5658 family protein n=1 Tax=Natrinema sp. DC36 TaxID=2878680 RepID=UPI001CEFEAC2|nr:DUF5658 family protein [Natrinema sp. DC36]